MSIFIYKLYNENDCYIGSTKHSLHKRLSQHKSPHNRCCSKFIIDSGNYKIEKLDEVDADERFKKEQQFINELSTLNNIHVIVSLGMIINDNIFWHTEIKQLANAVVYIPMTIKHGISNHRNM